MSKRLIVHAGQCQNIGKRDRQEDSVLVSDTDISGKEGMLFVLADGMGGMSEGHLFSEIATHKMTEHFENMEFNDDMCQTLQDCYDAAQQQALAAQKPDEGIEGGSTVTAVLIRGTKCACLSVGDSRIYLLRGGGLIQLNREQVLGSMLDERAALGVIDREDADLSYGRNSLVNHLGRKTEVPCDICSRPFELLVNDRIALMSDGVFGTLSDKRITEIMNAHPKMQDAADAIIAAVMAEDKARQDNCTVMVIGVDELDDE